MNKLVTAKVTLLVICVVQFGAASLNEAQSQNLVSLGSENSIVYIDIKKLPTEIDSENKSIYELYDAKRTPASFFETWTGFYDKCWAGSVLREGVIGYCLPYAKLGRHVSDRDWADRFISLDPFIGVYVWYEPAMNRFYLFSRSLTYVLGPFVGNPNIVLEQAIKQRKGERHLRGVNLSVVSQRWKYPDEKDVRMPRDEHYDCVHGHASGKVIEQVQLNTFFTRFRLVNSSGRDLYYLADLIADPVGYKFIKSVKRTDSDRALSRYDAYEQRTSLRWIRLPPSSSVEFEVVEIGWQQAKDQIYAVSLNTEPTYWDEVEIQGEYTSLFRTFKNEPVLSRVK